SRSGWPRAGGRVKSDRQLDGAGIPAVRQPDWFTVVTRISNALGQQPQRLGHVAASNEVAEAMMHAAAKAEMQLALRGNVEARREMLRVGCGRVRVSR